MNVIFFGLLASFSQSTTANMYKWIDENGNTHYTQSPPPDGIDGVIIKPPSSVDEDSALKTVEKQKKKADKLLENRKKQAEKEEKEQAEIDRLNKNCEISKSNVASLERPRVNFEDDEGNVYSAPEEERLERLKKAKEDVEEYCG